MEWILKKKHSRLTNLRIIVFIIAMRSMVAVKVDVTICFWDLYFNPAYKNSPFYGLLMNAFEVSQERL